MKILAICRDYAPDVTPFGRILRMIVEDQAAGGHQTTVITARFGRDTSRSSSTPRSDEPHNIELRRIRLLPEQSRWQAVRKLNWVWFLLRVVFHAVFAKQYNLIVADSHPPVAMGCMLRMIRAIRGTPYVYYCRDMYPETSVIGGKLSRGWLYNCLRRWDTATCNASHRVVVLSQDMADALTLRGVPTERISIVPSTPVSVKAAIPNLPSPLDQQSHVARILFAGNLGRYDGLERLVAASRLVAERVPFQLILMGDGSVKRELMKAAGELLDRHIIFIPHQPVDVAHAAMRICDYGIVSLSSDVYRFSYPSKSVTYWSAGCPVIAVVEPQSELSRTIETHGLGYVAASRSVQGIADILIQAVIERSEWTPARRKHIERTCAELYGPDRMLAAWDRIIRGDSNHPPKQRPHDETSIAA